MADKSKDKKSALSVQKGIEQPSSFNPNAAQFFKKKKDQPSIIDYFNGIRSGNRTILSQAITLIESGLEKHQEIARQIIEQCIPFSGQSIRIGITGVPGVGKSTFIEAFGKHLTSKKHQLAVLAIDPSSERTKGSILGDKTRMEELATDKNAFIRPSPSAGSLGGVARKTKEIIILCEAAGFDTILVETVGVGQSETAVHSMVDFFLLLMLAGAGDELQGIKRGIMEMADAIVINKADGDNINKAKLAKQEYENALHLFPPTESGWIPKVNTCSARSNIGIEEVWGNIEEYRSLSIENGYFNKRRITQEKRILTEFIKNSLSDRFFQDDIIQQKLPVIYKSLEEGRVSSYSAAQELLEKYFKGINS